jgi:predicted TIM-barrel fold metal-dependent hydrolase
MLRQAVFLQRLFIGLRKRRQLRIVLGMALLVGLLPLVFVVACRSTRNEQPSLFVLSGDTLAEFKSLTPIDAHTHVSKTGTAFVGMLERLNLRVLDILYVDDTDPARSSMEPQEEEALKFIASSRGRAHLCTTFNPFRFNNPDFSKEAIDGLNHDFEQGAIAAKLWKNVGMEVKNKSGKYVLPDDPAFEPIYKGIGAHDKTLIVHAADSDAAWDPEASLPPSMSYYKTHLQWLMSRYPDAPQKKTILQARDHVLAMNPKLRVVGAHLGSLEAHLDDLGAVLDHYPNFAVDTAARVPGLMRQPRDKVLAFILKYQDRILYGSDLHFDSEISDQLASQEWEKQYAVEWRYFATNDAFEYRGNRVQGLNLPHAVLQKLYHDNAIHWIPGIDSNRH